MRDLLVFGIDIQIHRALRGDDFFMLHGKTIVCSAGVARWMMLFSAAQGWPVRDFAAEEDDG